MKKLIAIVDDEQDIVELVKVNLEKAGFKPIGFSKATDFLDFMEKNHPDLVILDLMLPDIDGLEICRSLRQEEKFSSLPIIMLTARGDETDKVVGLELGADDYVVKPFSPRELIARIKAILRRYEVNQKKNKLGTQVDELLTIDQGQHRVLVKGKEVTLTATEFKILTFLISKPGWVFSREQILNHLWGEEKIVVDRTVDVHIRHLREKLGPAGQFIKNIRGVGYKYESKK